MVRDPFHVSNLTVKITNEPTLTSFSETARSKQAREDRTSTQLPSQNVNLCAELAIDSTNMSLHKLAQMGKVMI